MDLISQPLLTTSLQHLRAAFSADSQQQYKQAAGEYIEGATLLLQLSKQEDLTTTTKQMLKNKCQQYVQRAQLITSGLESKEDIPPLTAVDKSCSNMKDLEEDSKEFINSLNYIPFECMMDKVKGAAQVKEFLLRNVILPLMFPALPESVTRVKKGILLYGLPGTGKTMLLCAVAGAVSCPVFRVTASDLISRWRQGEDNVQRVKDLFVYARQNQPCVVILDDLDVLCLPEQREDSVTAKVREELATQLKDVSAQNQVTVMAATQKPWYLTGGLRRRFDRKFHLSLPEADDRAEIMSQEFSSSRHLLSVSDFDLLGRMTSGYTGADLSVLVRSCMLTPVRILQMATHFHKVTVMSKDSDDKSDREMMAPCESHEPGAVEISFEFLNPDRIQEPLVTMEMVEVELKRSGSSVCDPDLQQMEQWRKDFEQES